VHKEKQMKILAFKFMPFPERARSSPDDCLIGLDFTINKEISKTLKRAIKHFHDKAVRNKVVKTSPGGWLPSHKCWYVDPEIWPDVREMLVNIGCSITEEEK